MSTPRVKAQAAEPSNVDIVVYALATIGGAERFVHSEDIAARAFELAPPRFSWRLEKYRNRGWPDKYVVKTALEDAKKEEYGSLVDGAYALDTAKDGWRLTPLGAEWFTANKRRIADYLGEKAPELPRKDVERFLKRVRATALFRRYLSSGTIAPRDFFDLADLLDCSPDTSRKLIAVKFQNLYATGRLVRDPQILRLFEACACTFADLRGATTSDRS